MLALGDARSGRILKRRPRPGEDPKEVPGYPRLPDRCKPEKSPDHDAPWPGATNWHPRRWFADVAPSWEAPLTISVSKAAQEEVLKALTDDYEDRLNTEIDRRRNAHPEALLPERPPPRLHPSAWAFHVEISANAFSQKRKECERRREAAICGLLSNFRCV